jgi:hypothetical protein
VPGGRHACHRDCTAPRVLRYCCYYTTHSLTSPLSGTVSQWAADAVPLTSTGEPGDDEVETSAFMYGGYCAPFDMAIVVLVLGGLYMSGAWSENYGEPPAANAQAPSQLDALRKGAAVVFRDPRVLLVGLCSALFEGSMFTFVFMWTPALTPPGESPPYVTVSLLLLLLLLLVVLLRAAPAITTPTSTTTNLLTNRLQVRQDLRHLHGRVHGRL